MATENELKGGEGTLDTLLANLPEAEYEFMRRRLARERGWRVSFLDRLRREAQRKGTP